MQLISFLDLLEAAHLICRLPPFGYGKEVLRARCKVYLADPAIAGSVLLRGSSLLEDTTRLGGAVETAVFKHIFARRVASSANFSYWRGGRGDHEVDIVEESQTGLMPFEVKYAQGMVQASDLKGMIAFCGQRGVAKGCVMTGEMSDFGLMSLSRTASAKATPAVMRVPASLACIWLSQHA